jgi:ADP-heptose:LPS heptosyltransferase
MKSRGKILVIRGGAIGDFILTLPVLAALRQQFPDTRLEVLGYPRIAELAVVGGLADAVRSIESRAFAGFFANGAVLDKDAAEYFAGFDLILSFLYDPDAHFEENVLRVSTAQFIAGPHRPEDAHPAHACDTLLKPLERLAIFGADAVPALPLLPEGEAPRTVEALLAVHPGSGSERKNWPEWRWREFLGALIEREPVRLLLLGGEAESGRLQRLASCLPGARVEVVESRPLTEVARRLETCVAFIGHDSGITHLAAALGMRGLALWGDTSADVWRPRGDRICLVRDPAGLAGLQVRTVLDATVALLHVARTA